MSSRSETSLKDTKYVPECLKWMLIAAAILIAIGAMNVYNATYYMNMAAGDGPYTHFVKHIGVLALGLAIGAVVAWLPKGFIRGGAFVGVDLDAQARLGVDELDENWEASVWTMRSEDLRAGLGADLGERFAGAGSVFDDAHPVGMRADLPRFSAWGRCRGTAEAFADAIASPNVVAINGHEQQGI